MAALINSILVGLITFAILTIMNAILAYAVYLYKKEFDWNKMLEFLKRRVAVYILIWFSFSMINVAILYVTEKLGFEISLGLPWTMAGIINAISLLIIALLGKKIIEKFSILNIEIGKKK